MLIIKLQDHFPLRACDWLLASMLLTWGLACLYVPSSTWELPMYSGLARLAGQTSWGVFASTLGFVRMAALFINGAVQRTPHVRMAGAFFSAFLWLQLAFATFAAEVATISIALYPWLFAADIYNVWRAAQDASDSDHRAKMKEDSARDATVT